MGVHGRHLGECSVVVEKWRFHNRGKLENPNHRRLYESWARLRSQHPLASSQLSRDRTLARARAIEQSAAP